MNIYHYIIDENEIIAKGKFKLDSGMKFLIMFDCSIFSIIAIVLFSILSMVYMGIILTALSIFIGIYIVKEYDKILSKKIFYITEKCIILNASVYRFDLIDEIYMIGNMISITFTDGRLNSKTKNIKIKHLSNIDEVFIACCTLIELTSTERVSFLKAITSLKEETYKCETEEIKKDVIETKQGAKTKIEKTVDDNSKDNNYKQKNDIKKQENGEKEKETNLTKESNKESELKPNKKICSHCGEENDASRFLCFNCGRLL